MVNHVEDQCYDRKERRESDNDAQDGGADRAEALSLARRAAFKGVGANLIRAQPRLDFVDLVVGSLARRLNEGADLVDLLGKPCLAFGNRKRIGDVLCIDGFDLGRQRRIDGNLAVARSLIGARVALFELHLDAAKLFLMQLLQPPNRLFYKRGKAVGRRLEQLDRLVHPVEARFDDLTRRRYLPKQLLRRQNGRVGDWDRHHGNVVVTVVFGHLFPSAKKSAPDAGGLSNTPMRKTSGTRSLFSTVASISEMEVPYRYGWAVWMAS